MSLERVPLEHGDNATQSDWFAPLAMFIAWLAHFFEQVAKLKRIRRTTKFNANWRDHWAGLRQSEWHRDQLLAAGAVQLLSGHPLDLSDYQLIMDPPASYGGPCPTTPFEMNRRFLAITRWLADPEAAIRGYAARIAHRAGVDLSNPLAAHGSTDAWLRHAAHHELMGATTLVRAASPLALTLSSARSARPSKDERAHARGPPTPPRPKQFPQPVRNPLQGSHPLARSPEPAYPPTP